MIANGRYRILEKFGQGAFGAVCRGQCTKTDKNYAVKMEHIDSGTNLIKHESTVLFFLQQEKCKNIPYVYYYGFQSPYTCMVISYFDQGSLNVWKHYLHTEEKIDWWDTMMETFEFIHKAGIVHRDLKPAHFIRNRNHEWQLIDFGLATSFLDENQLHVEDNTKTTIIGSPNYVSLYVHQGHTHVRRDDFLSLCYIFAELFSVKLFDDYTDNISEDQTPVELEYPYNQWLRDQKEWTNLYEKLKDNNICNYCLIHAEGLNFKDKPNYQGCKIGGT